MSGVASADFLPKEEGEANTEPAPEDAEDVSGAPGGGDTGGSGEEEGVMLQRKLNDLLENSRESRKPGGTSSPEELQQQLNAAFHNSKESRSKGPPEMYSEWMPSQAQSQYRGQIRSFSESKGFGFIDCAETMQQFGRDVFVHKVQLHESGAWVGQEVLFEVELNKMGHPQARNIVLANPGEAMWDYSSWYDNNMQYDGYDYNSMPTVPQRTESSAKARDTDRAVSHQNVEDMIRQCNSPARMQEIIEQYGQHFVKRHVVTALYQLGLCRQNDKKQGYVQVQELGSLTRALIDRLVHIPPEELQADEASNVQWALAALDEVKSHQKALQYAFQLGQQAKKRYMEFSPAQMATFVSALSRLVQQPADDELVCQIVTTFSEYSSGNGTFPKFPPEELKVWTAFLEEASQPMQGRQQQAAMGMGGMPQNMGGMPQNMGGMPQNMGMRPNYPQGGMGMNNASGMGGMNPMAMGGCMGGPNMQQQRMQQQMPMRPQTPFGGGYMGAGKGMKGPGSMPDGMMGKSSGKGGDGFGGKMGMSPPGGKGMGAGGCQGGSLLGGGTMKNGLPGLTSFNSGPTGGLKGGPMEFSGKAAKGGDRGFKGGKGGKGDYGKGKGKGKDLGGKSPSSMPGGLPLQPGSVGA